MARFIPVGQVTDYHGSPAERRVYSAFKQLPDDYCVFYSVRWGKDHNGHYQKGEADFLVFDPSRGFLVIEVKGGGVECEGGHWFSTSRKGERYLLPRSPLNQAWRSVNRFKEILEDSDIDTVRNYKLIPTVWFPDMTETELEGKLPTDYQPSNTFTEHDLKDPEQAISYAFGYNDVKRQTFPESSNQLIEATINVFAPSFRIVPSISSELKERDFLFNQLTNEQASLLDYLVEQRTAAIHGASGTGKTMIALECARRLPKDTNILFLCFNKLIIQYLKDNFSAELPNVTFANLNQLYAKSGGKEYATTDELTNFLLSSFSDNYQFEHIIVDEAQDFAADHLDFLADIMQATGGYFYVFYDKNQLVHRWDLETIEWLKKSDCRLVLNKNCRNTREIARTAYSPLGHETVTLAEIISGDTPCLNNYQDTTSAIQGIAETIRFYTEKGFTKNQITILTLKTLEKTILRDRDSINGYRLTHELNGNGILFTTARKFKGLESDVVIIIDFDEDAFKDDNAKNVFYVASSRAKHCLTFIASLDDAAISKIITDLDAVPGSNPKSTLKNLLSIDFQSVHNNHN